MKEVACNCSVCRCTIRATIEEFNFGGMCSLCRNDIHDARNVMEKLAKIKKVADKWYETRYDTDWDELHGRLQKIRNIVRKK